MPLPVFQCALHHGRTPVALFGPAADFVMIDRCLRSFCGDTHQTETGASAIPWKPVCTNPHMPIQIVRNEVPQALQESIVKGVFSAIGNRAGLWEVDIISDLNANAWDVEVVGPDNFYWARRFSGEDRDAEVISEAIRSAVHDQAA
jgi:hypothetical protein